MRPIDPISLIEMREWLEGFSTDGVTPMTTTNLSDDEVVIHVERMYDGGVDKFIKDGEELVFSFDELKDGFYEEDDTLG